MALPQCSIKSMVRSHLAILISLSTLILTACQAEPAADNAETTPSVQADVTAETPIKETISDARAAEIKQAALDLFAWQEGRWASKWEWLDKDGNVVGTFEGEEEFKPLVDEYSQMMINRVPSQNQISYVLLSYNPVEHEIAFLNVGPKGQYWVMKQDPETMTMVSEPTLLPNGQEITLRFTTLRKDADSMDVQMERSLDRGQTWQVGFRQYMTRIKDDG